MCVCVGWRNENFVSELIGDIGGKTRKKRLVSHPHVSDLAITAADGFNFWMYRCEIGPTSKFLMGSAVYFGRKSIKLRTISGISHVLKWGRISDRAAVRICRFYPNGIRKWAKI